MHRHSRLSSPKSVQSAYYLASDSVFDFLVPAFRERASSRFRAAQNFSTTAAAKYKLENEKFNYFFIDTLNQVSRCSLHKITHKHVVKRRFEAQQQQVTYGTLSMVHKEDENSQADQRTLKRSRLGSQTPYNSKTTLKVDSNRDLRGISGRWSMRKQKRVLQWLEDNHSGGNLSASSWFPPNFFDNAFDQHFAGSTKLPLEFFKDVNDLRMLNHISGGAGKEKPIQSTRSAAEDRMEAATSTTNERMTLLKSIRELEERLADAKKRLNMSLTRKDESNLGSSNTTKASENRRTLTLSKEDYKNLVDLYYYSHNSRFSPEATDLSPTPTFLDDYSFELSADFRMPDGHAVNEDENYRSPQESIHETLKSRKLHEIAVMQVFVDLLLDESSSNRALYDAYKCLPTPGVAFLPKGVIRLFLQRMSTPWTHSEKSMLQYLSLIDDMQKAKIPITSGEWSSAIYLTGRSFAKVTEQDVATSFKIWQQMENEAGVKSSHVTLNILFDIAVRAGKFALGETILKEMSKRNLRLNRFGRVSLIYYHGLRGDGDGVRKTYRDFVEAGEIVDTVVLNCVISSLLNAQEPTAAELVYERMKSMYSRAQNEFQGEISEEPYIRYPPPGESSFGQDMASNHLGRILLKAPHLQKILPSHHTELQSNMPLAPDFVTFRSMIAYHATKSGDLDRIAVLLHEMTALFEIPLRPLVFQLLFKGFALHGPTTGPEGDWSVKRLELCWNAFRQAVKETQGARHLQKDVVVRRPDLSLPSMTQINAIPPNAPIPSFQPQLCNPPQTRLSQWNEFVLDLAIFPRERLRRIERFHAQMFDDEKTPKPHESRKPYNTFNSPFFQSTIYQAPEPDLDHEEGEYVLPSSSETALQRPDLNENFKPYSHATSTRSNTGGHYSDSNSDIEDRVTTQNEINANPHLVRPTRPLICWLLRAYARNTKSRAKVEEIWGVVRKMWQPRDAAERESVVRVLRRCLRDCDI